MTMTMDAIIDHSSIHHSLYVYLVLGVTPNIMSPDNLWQHDGKMSSYAGTPTEFRRESIRSSLSMMKQKIFGTSERAENNADVHAEEPANQKRVNAQRTKLNVKLKDLAFLANVEQAVRILTAERSSMRWRFPCISSTL